MAKTVILHVIMKIGTALAGETITFAKPLLAKKSKLVVALPRNMKLIKNELELIHAFLKGIDRKGAKNEVIEAWIVQVRKLAYEMEDAVDQFVYVVGEHSPKGTWDYFKRIGKKPSALFSLDGIASKVKRINQDLKHLSEIVDRWTKPLDSGIEIPPASYETEHVYLPGPGHDYLIEDHELVGTDKNKRTLIGSLRSEDQSVRIIAVWGMGGVGKSTLVNSVHRTEAFRFDFRLWVSISQSYKLDDILREVLVDNGLGSRIIVTTRMEEVASIADEDYKIKVEPLGDHDSWLLFCRKAFPKIDNHVCPPDLQTCCDDIVQKIKGLPLALVAIGSLLSLKPRTENEWRNFCNQLTWELHSNESLNHVEKVLNLSYKYLQGYLKNCFLYSAIFPEDYLIHRKRLIRLWIAEGFIEQKGACTLEDIADGYLGELVRRSMFQVVQRNSFGRIKSFRMHDLVRELAIFQSRKENFSTICDGNHGVIPVGLDPRRLSVLQSNNGILSNINPSRLRTLITFDIINGSSSWYSSFYSKSKYLAVLDLSGLPISTVPKSLGDLFNLRLLCLDNTKVMEIPKSIKKLQNLQTLSIEHTQLFSFPHGVSKLKKLQHIMVSRSPDVNNGFFNGWEGVKPFKGLWHLAELQTLFAIKASEQFVAKLRHLTQLRTLEICDVRTSHCAQLCNSLSDMHQLSRLLIRACNEDELLQLDSLTFPNPLQKLDIVGRLSEKTLESPFFLNHGHALLEIHLVNSQLSKNQLLQLSELTKLTELYLGEAYNGEELHFHTDSFRNLKRIHLVDLAHVNAVSIDEGALLNVEHICVRNLQELWEVPVGISFLTSVKEAVFTDMHPEFPSNVLKEMLNHVPNVYVTTKGN
ncbi:unnamed protein product [Urochloa decumbens]|uniref:Uncharacterized protein n=1 Tax=Urochloa decumbens TaxID=240449 RepID=A0ABC8YT31_9POAL